MTLHLGNIPAGITLYVPFHTFDANGASVTISGLAVGDIKIYKNGSTTERASTSGFTLLDTDGIDFDSVTGLHGFSVDLSDNTDAGFYAAGAFYWIVVSTITVNAQTVSFVAATFRIVASDPLMPTVAGRTLDVSAGGEAGIDWANIGSPTTTVSLSGTTVKTATDVETDTQDIQSRLPAALVSGRIDASVGAMATGVLTATAIAADAITDAKVASDVTIASVTGSVGSIATGGITSGSFAAGAIDAAAIAADAIGSSELAASAVTEIQSGLSTLDAAGVRSAVGLASANLDTQLDAIPTANENADALLDRSAGVETNRTLRQALRLMLSALCGKASGMATTTAVFRDTNDTVNRITATVDSSGNRSAVTLDAS